VKAWYKPYQLKFKQPILTSRGGMEVKNGFYLFISDGKATGIGECSFIEGLSIDDLTGYEQELKRICDAIESGSEPAIDIHKYPSIVFGYQAAMLDIKNGGRHILFESSFTEGRATIPINGLCWMGSEDFMLRQVTEKLQKGFKCIKIKVGALNFEKEMSLIEYIRQRFSAKDIEIRLDANGAFNKNDVFQKLEALAQFKIHSIEQPVKAGQWSLMHEVCSAPFIPVALDEELIGLSDEEEMDKLLSTVCPQYIILKPSLTGGFEICDKWIAQAAQYETGWWATSALESNVGLNAIAQWVYTKNSPLVQGLGTGNIYLKNVQSPLKVSKGALQYNPLRRWHEPEID
jgi:o-succinylbenzoate synthase